MGVKKIVITFEAQEAIIPGSINLSVVQELLMLDYTEGETTAFNLQEEEVDVLFKVSTSQPKLNIKNNE